MGDGHVVGCGCLGERQRIGCGVGHGQKFCRSGGCALVRGFLKDAQIGGRCVVCLIYCGHFKSVVHLGTEFVHIQCDGQRIQIGDGYVVLIDFVAYHIYVIGGLWLTQG